MLKKLKVLFWLFRIIIYAFGNRRVENILRGILIIAICWFIMPINRRELCNLQYNYAMEFGIEFNIIGTYRKKSIVIEVNT